MIKITVKKAALERGIKTPYQLSRAMGQKGQTIASKLWNWKPGCEYSPPLQTLDLVAEALNCDLGDLVTRVPEKRRTLPRARRSGSKKEDDR